MKVLHLIASSDLRGGGPIAGVLSQASERVSMLGIDTHLATLDHPSDPWVSNCPIPIFALGLPRNAREGLWRLLPWRRYGYSARMVPWLRENINSYDIVVVNGLWNYTALAARRVLTNSNKPYVVFPHGMLDPWFRGKYPLKHVLKQVLWLFCEGPLLRRANGVFFTAEEERTLARKTFWPYCANEIVVGYGSADPPASEPEQVAAFKQAVPDLGERPFLLNLGRIHPKKGCDILLNAFADVARKYPRLDLVIAGPDQDGWQRKLLVQSERLGISKRVHWAGMLRGNAKWGAFRSCLAFVLPSHQENFGIVIVEAMACAKPVIITDKVNIWREIEMSGAGLVCSDTKASLCIGIDNFMSLAADEINAMGRNARIEFLRRYEIALVAEEIANKLKSYTSIARNNFLRTR